MTLHLFLPTGKTFTFKNVTILSDNETAITFNYTAMSDGHTKKGTFQKASIVGWSND